MQSINSKNRNLGSKKRRRQRRPRQVDKGWTDNRGYSLSSHYSPAFARPFPKEFSVALTDRTVQSLALGVLNTLVYGVVEYLGRDPMYRSQFYNMYKYSRITAVTVQATLINTSDTPAEMVMAVLPFQDLTGLTLDKLVEKQGSIRKIISPKGGIDKASLSKTAVAEKEFGNPYLDRDFWIDSSQAASIVPLDTREPILALGIQALTSSGTAWVEVKTTYHIQFFDPVAVSST